MRNPHLVDADRAQRRGSLGQMAFLDLTRWRVRPVVPDDVDCHLTRSDPESCCSGLPGSRCCGAPSYLGADVLDHADEGIDRLDIDGCAATLAVHAESGVRHAKDPAPDDNVDLPQPTTAPTMKAHVALDRGRVPARKARTSATPFS